MQGRSSIIWICIYGTMMNFEKSCCTEAAEMGEEGERFVVSLYIFTHISNH